MLLNLFTALILAEALFLFVASLDSDPESNFENKRKDVCREGKVDAATKTKDGTTYFFQGDYYWKYSEIDGGIVYLGLIADDWKGVEGSIDAAVTWDDGTTFFFKGDDYWRLINKEVLPGYPRKINNGFRGIPNHLDAALLWSKNGVTYFFKEDQYWRFDPKANAPTDGKPAPISSWNGVPDSLDAAMRWEKGQTYFFKGSSYYKYDNDVEEVNLSQYPKSTVKEWFDCEKQATVWKYFERELPKEAEKTTKDILDAIAEVKNAVEGLSTAGVDARILKPKALYL